MSCTECELNIWVSETLQRVCFIDKWMDTKLVAFCATNLLWCCRYLKVPLTLCPPLDFVFWVLLQLPEEQEAFDSGGFLS